MAPLDFAPSCALILRKGNGPINVGGVTLGLSEGLSSGPSSVSHTPEAQPGNRQSFPGAAWYPVAVQSCGVVTLLDLLVSIGVPASMVLEVDILFGNGPRVGRHASALATPSGKDLASHELRDHGGTVNNGGRPSHDRTPALFGTPEIDRWLIGREAPFPSL